MQLKGQFAVCGLASFQLRDEGGFRRGAQDSTPQAEACGERRSVGKWPFLDGNCIIVERFLINILILPLINSQPLESVSGFGFQVSDTGNAVPETSYETPSCKMGLLPSLVGRVVLRNGFMHLEGARRVVL